MRRRNPHVLPVSRAAAVPAVSTPSQETGKETRKALGDGMRRRELISQCGQSGNQSRVCLERCVRRPRHELPEKSLALKLPAALGAQDAVGVRLDALLLPL